jgi:hypothetical protein
MRKLTLFFLALQYAAVAQAQGVKISEDTDAPDPSAILDVSSTTQGFLPPRMSAAERDAIASPASGLIIYNSTTRCLETFIEPVWQQIYCGCDPPAAPAAGSHSSTADQIGWNWNGVSGATGYKYNLSNDYASASDAGTDTFFEQGGLTCGSSYSLYVWAYGNCGHSESVELSHSTAACCGSGELNPDFGEGGVITANVSSGNDAIRGMALQSAALYLAGYHEIGAGDFSWRFEKRDPVSGDLIPSFGAGGVVTSNPSSGDDACWGIVADESGLFIGGYDRSLSDMRWRIEKRDLNSGALIPSFGSSGVVSNNPSAGTDQILGLSIDDSGLYAGGSDNAAGNLKWRIEKRNLTDGAVIWTQTNNPSSSSDEVWCLASDGTALYVGGYDSAPGNQQWRIEKRSAGTGDLISAFGSSGVVASNPSSGNDQIRSMALDESGVYVAGYDASAGNDQWRVEKRDLNTGNLISSFGTGGVITVNPSSGAEGAFTVWVDSDGLYIAGSDLSPGDAQWRMEKRNPTTGALEWMQTTNPSPLSELPMGIVSETGQVYFSGRDQIPGNNQWRIEKRCK